MVFRTSEVLANPRLEIEDPLCHCSVRMQNSAAASIVKILELLNRLADRVVWIMVRKLGELPKFLVFHCGIQSFGNSSIFYFYLLLFAFIQISVFAFEAFDRGLATLLCLCFRWSPMIILTFTSSRIGDCVLWACIARGCRECCTMHSSALVTMGMLQSTVVDCPGFTTWTGVRLA
jgi:hypothetical protein